MLITSKDVRRFQQLYEEKFGQLLTSEQAEVKLALLIRQVELTYSPISLEQLERVIAAREQRSAGYE